VGLADYAEAWHCLDQSLLVSVQNRQKDREGWTRFDMASLAAKEQRQDEAEHQIRESIIAFRENNEDLSMTYCLIKLAEFCVMWGQFDRAAFILGSAERALKELGVEIQPREMAQLAELHDKIGLLQNEKDRSKKWNRGQQVTLDQAVALVLQFSPEHFDLLAK